jgi:GT2 family glycosyltransferase/ADP-heptose:LPS heptosyltransferase
MSMPDVTPGVSVEYPVPTWFKATEKADVSVIIPLYKSKKEIQDLIKSWHWDEPYKVEIIFVDDKCPQKSKDSVIEAWNKRTKRKVGNIIANQENLGYGGACNAGAQAATGDYLVFLNADTTVTPRWIGPMVDRLKDPSIGIVGNLHLKEGGKWNGTIDSAGSEWRWDAMSFVHIGRHSHNQQNLDEPMRPETAPKDVISPGDRDMVTGCCFAIRRDLFLDIGGFNLNYRIGYWEDSEICMTVKEKGYRIFFEPNSVINHKLGHSSSGEHVYQEYNRNYFMNKWVNSNRIDPLVEAKRKSKTTVRGILVQRAAAHGDVLVAAAVVPALKKKHPNCNVTFYTKCPKMLVGNPHIDSVIEKLDNISERSFQVYYNLDMAYELRPKTNILESYADLVGVKVEDCELYTPTCQPRLKVPESYVVIHPGRTNWVGRDWHEEGFVEIAKRLMAAGEKVVCIGRAEDRGVPCDQDVRGSTTIQELGNVIKGAKAFVGIDSMPMHIAQSFDIPGVCFFGSIRPETRLLSSKMKSVTADNLPCLGCHHRKAPPSTVTNFCETSRLECIKSVNPDMFWNKVKEVLVCQV